MTRQSLAKTALADQARPVEAHSEPRLGIGALARAADIPVETLRTWERRYGFPIGMRDEAGQRHYHLSTPVHLLLIKQALQLGMRAAQVVPLPLHELRRVLAESDVASKPTVEAPPVGSAPEPLPPDQELTAELARWIDAVRRFDAAALSGELQRAWNQVGSVAFLDDLARPFMIEVGQRWARGELNVAHEHFATEQLRARLSDMAGADRHGAPTVICANLPGEMHSLGLEMAAVVVRQTGLRVLYLGADMPLTDLAQAVRYAHTFMTLIGVVVSLSASIEVMHARDQMARLRSLVPQSVPVLAGGGGAPSDVAGVLALPNLRSLQVWAQNKLA